MRSARKDKAAGKADTIGGHILEFFGKLTGDRKSQAKGKAARGRGAFRTGKGKVKGSA
jgi:uncharacterized protein YjbJ (UPF0337 family)